MTDLHRPIPRRPFDLPEDSDPEPVPRSRSTVNLTTSTLFGIYGTSLESQAPTRTNSSANLLDLSSPLSSLSQSKPTYSSPLSPSPEASALTKGPYLPGEGIWRVAGGYGYLGLWGAGGVIMGSLLPWIDEGSGIAVGNKKSDWTPVIRSVGAFVGVAYAIRKLPWQSTAQVTLALALVNPFLWFLVDRTLSGLLFAATVGAAGTAAVWAAGHQLETVYVASVLFCSCVTFGNVGRRLAVRE
ncbi:INSIG domain protein [Pyronema omphalodes]|nr:INSIG domain protein [Pyronema omphalodes]